MEKENLEKSFDENTLNEYEEKYSEDGLWSKVKENAKSIGAGLIYKAFQLYYVAQSPNCPMKLKAMIFGALGYLISPIDLIPDFTPLIGYADDLTAMGVVMALVMSHFYIDDDVKFKAKKKIADLLGDDFVREIE